MRLYDSWLLEEFEKRKFQDSLYSIRRFAKDLDVSPTLISQILNGKYEVTHKTAKKLLLNIMVDNKDEILEIYKECDRKKKKISRLLKSHIKYNEEEVEVLGGAFSTNLNLLVTFKFISQYKPLGSKKNEICQLIFKRIGQPIETTLLSVNHLEKIKTLRFDGNQLVEILSHRQDGTEAPDMIRQNLELIGNKSFDRFNPDYGKDGKIANYSRNDIRGVDLIEWEYIYLNTDRIQRYNKMVKMLVSDLKSLEKPDIRENSYIYYLSLQRFKFNPLVL